MTDAVSSPKGLAANVGSLLVGTTGSKALALVSVLLLSRYLGVEDFGRYSLVFSFFALLNTLVDLGVTTLLSREIVRNIEAPRKSIETAVYLRLLGCLVFIPPALLIAPHIGLDLNLALVASAGLFFGFEAFYDAWFSAVMRLDGAAKSRFIAGLINLILTALAVFMKLGLWWIVVIGLVNPAIKLIFDRRYGGAFSWQLGTPDLAAIKSMLKDTLPLWWMGIMFIILARVDTFMLVALLPGRGEYELGIYSAAFRFSEMLALVTNAIAPAILPLLVQAKEDPERMRWITTTGTRVIMAALLMVSMVMFWYAPLIIRIFYGEQYLNAIPNLQVLVWSQALVAVNTLCYQILVVYNAQGKKPVLASSIFVMLLNIALNFWLIPKYAAVGASLTTLFTEIGATMVLVYFLERYTGNRIFMDILRLEALAALACLPVALLGNYYWGGLAIVVFAVLLFVTKTITKEDVASFAGARISRP